MFENGKMRPVESIPGIGRGRIRRMMEEGTSTMIYCKNFVNVTMYPQYNINMIIKKTKKSKF
jgi:hypothetical protein